MQNDNPNKAIIYCRVSSDRQVRDGDGLGSQESRCKQYAAQLGLTVESVFRDEGISGAIYERPAMQQVLKFLDSKYPDPYVVIFDNLDRIARQTDVYLKLKAALMSRGAIMKSPNFNFENTPEGRMVETMSAGFAQYHREVNARQVGQRMKSKMENGIWCLCPPTGMKFIEDPVYKKIITPKEPEAGVLKEAIEGYANNRFISQTDVLHFLSGKKHLLGKEKIHLEFVNRILTKILYAGYVEYSPWGITRRVGKHEGFISIDTFDKVQEKLKKGERKLQKTDNTEFPLRRLVVCSVCGKQMTGSKNKGKLKYYANYTCNNSHCSAKPKSIQKQILETAYMALLNKIRPSVEILDLTKVIALDMWNQAVSNSQEGRKALQKEIEDREKAINVFLERIFKATDEDITKQYEIKISQLTQEIKDLKIQTSADSNLKFGDALKQVLDFIGTPAKYWENADIEGKHMIHRLIFTEKPSYNKAEGFGTPSITLPFQLNSQFEIKEKVLVEMPGVEPGCKDQKRRLLQS